jgi:hypothetical protein
MVVNTCNPRTQEICLHTEILSQKVTKEEGEEEAMLLLTLQPLQYSSHSGGGWD